MATYAKQTTLEKESYVYEQLLKNKTALSPAELHHATGYINKVRRDAGLAPLIS